MLNETVEADSSEAADHVIFQQSVQPPWQLVARVNDETGTMNSSVLTVGDMAIRTADRHVQEDTLLMQFGETPATVAFFAPFPVDLLDFTTPNSALAFDVKLQSGTGIQAGIACGDNCAGMVQLGNFMVDTNEWQAVEIPTKCLIEAGANLKEVYAPLRLSVKGQAQLSVSNLRLTQHGKPTTHCP